jgi:hypothetical protein
MNFIEVVFMIMLTLVVVEFGIHVIYHAITGKGSIDEAPFEYLKDVFAFAKPKSGTVHRKSIDSNFQRWYYSVE